MASTLDPGVSHGFPITEKSVTTSHRLVLEPWMLPDGA